MGTRRTLIVTGLAVAGLAGMAACGPIGGAGIVAGAPTPAPSVSTTLPVTVVPDHAAPVLADAPTTAAPTPVPSPTVAKVQKWVKIYSGRSAKDIKPPKKAGQKTHTIELDATASHQIGTYVADGAGRTLYRFDDD